MRWFHPLRIALCAMIVISSVPAFAELSEWRGLKIETVTPELAQAKNLAAAPGVLVVSVGANSLAEAAGLRPGDVVVAVADIPVASVEQFLALVRQREDEASISLTRVRGAADEAAVTLSLKSLKRFKTRGFSANDVDEKSATDDGTTAGEKPYRTVKVHYATDRNATGSADPNAAYGSDRGALVYGSCIVTIPAKHSTGAVEAPSMLKLEFSEDPAKHVVLASVKQQAAADFYNDIAAKAASSPARSAFVFVHGYNVKFKDAAKRTAQMAFDLKFAGAPVFFSWPSTGKYLGYVVDEGNVEFGRADLKKFLTEFASQSSIERIFVIAHSMGNRALVTALSDVLRDSPAAKAKIKDVILAAPDIDADVFKREIAPALVSHGQSVTLYASSNDWALTASKKFHGYPRAGDAGRQLTLAEGVATIDSSEVVTDLLGHSYFSDSGDILKDIAAIIDGKSLPGMRDYLQAVDAAGGRYWKLPAASR